MTAWFKISTARVVALAAGFLVGVVVTLSSSAPREPVPSPAVVTQHIERSPVTPSSLVAALQACRGLPYPYEAECADSVSSDLMELARRGDVSLLKPLFDISDLADGAFAESLDSFYGEMLDRDPKSFLLTLSSYSPQAQRGFCSAAAIADGSGIDDDTAVKVKASLTSISLRKNDSLRIPARNCLAGFEDGLAK